MNKLLDGNHPFGRRCTAALTHPLTVGALGLLLLNDLLLKALWSNPWTTGKLSDLAWVVFASPLLAFLLSPVARRSSLGERIVFLTAYAGLPVLYAAFNTFPVVHDGILWGLSFAGGTGLGAPHDPTDSLVIPVGLAVAVWVWRREPPESNSLRMRFGLVIAGVAALASVASTPPDTVVGVTAVQVEPDGTIVSAGVEYVEGNWARGDRGAQSVETPRGTYTIEGSSIMRTHNGERTVAYSTRYLREYGNINVQRRATRSFGLRELTKEPYSLIYDERSGNVVLAMGLQGAVVGTPDGQWTRVAVGGFVPTDFSIVNKLLLLRDWELWLVAAALAFSITASAMAFSYTAPATAPAQSISYSNKRLVVTVAGAILLSAAILLFTYSFALTLLIIVLILPIFTFIGMLSLGPWRKTGRVVVSVLAVIASVGGMMFYAVGDNSDPNFNSATFLSVSGAGVGLILALLAVAVSYGDLRWALSASAGTGSANFIIAEIRKGLLPAIAASVFGMLALFSLSFLLWTLVGTVLVVAKGTAIALVALAAFMLRRYLGSKLPSSSQLVSTPCPCGCGGEVHPASSSRR